MKIEVSTGELLDKFSILQIKLGRITDPEKLINIRKEYEILRPICEELLCNEVTAAEFNKLVGVNSTLWDVEDALRRKEKTEEYDGDFITLARTVYITNDQRAAIKKTINVLTRSELVEEKSY
jgi:hypothetical protein